MAFLAALIIAFTQFDGATRWLVILAGAAVEVVEATLMIWWSRRRRPAVGAETFVGRTARVAVACTPVGQVRIDGELWQATCDGGADAGETVTITGRSGLTLTVRREDT